MGNCGIVFTDELDSQLCLMLCDTESLFSPLDLIKRLWSNFPHTWYIEASPNGRSWSGDQTKPECPYLLALLAVFEFSWTTQLVIQVHMQLPGDLLECKPAVGGGRDELILPFPSSTSDLSIVPFGTLHSLKELKRSIFPSAQSKPAPLRNWSK